LFAYVTIAALAVRVAWSAYGLPYAALGAELSNDYHERSSIVAWRQFFGVMAQFGCVILGFSVFLHGPRGLLDRAAYTPFGWTCALIIVVGASTAAFGTLPLRARLHGAAAGRGHPVMRLFREIGEVVRNASFRSLALTVIIFFIAQGTYLVLLLHALKFFWALPANIIQLVTLSTQIGLLVGLPLMAVIGRRYEKRDILIASAVVICAGQFFPPLLRIFNLIPANGPVLNGILTAVLFALGAATMCATISFQSAFADATDEHELLFGARREGLYYAALSLSVKASAGIGALVAGLELDLIGFPSDIAGHPNVHIAAETLRNLGVVYGPVAATITALGTLILFGYRLDKKEHTRILGELSLRRALTAQAGQTDHPLEQEVQT
jgi:GPH family glycoside/pentoside/hexuronide:cation symporter